MISLYEYVDEQIHQKFLQICSFQQKESIVLCIYSRRICWIHRRKKKFLKVNLQRDQPVVKMFCTISVVCGWCYNIGGEFAVAFKLGLVWNRICFCYFLVTYQRSWWIGWLVNSMVLILIWSKLLVIRFMR